jgi:hypothetical protein
MRQCIERAFGLLTQRWGIFWRPLRCEFKKWSLVATVCAKLHNFCINDVPISQHRYYEDVEDDDEPLVFLNNDGPTEDTQPFRAGSATNRRLHFTRQLELKGIRRPQHAAMNSRA